MPSETPRPAGIAPGGRTLVLLGIAVAVALPAGLLRAGCVGDTCREQAPKASSAPFCSLPPSLRDQVAAGYRKGRSPEVFGIAAAPGLSGPVGREWRTTHSADFRVPWPWAGSRAAAALVLGGAGFRGGPLPEEASLEDLAPTVAAAMGLERPHPEVRSGSAWASLVEPAQPRLVLEIVWKSPGLPRLQSSKDELAEALSSLGTVTEVPAGSVPADPAALLATIGSGASPKEHGITGTLLRDDKGRLVRAWSKEAPSSVVAMLADDLDRFTEGRARIGLVGDSSGDKGLVGSDWYLTGDEDEIQISPRATPEAQARRATEFLRAGFGDDEIPDLLAVTLSGVTNDMRKATQTIIEAAEAEAAGEVLFAIVALPPDETTSVPVRKIGEEIERAVGAPVIEAIAGGGFFTDQDVLATEGIGEDAILQAMDALQAPGSGPVFADRFTGVAITFERYC